jgi:hypothetical protein
MTSSGRCHGPGCRETAIVEGGFCGEGCQDRWHGQFDQKQVVHARTLEDAWTVVGWTADDPLRNRLRDAATSQPWRSWPVQAVSVECDLDADLLQLFWGSPTSSGDAEFPQVASKNPQVAEPCRGWLSRLFNRLSGRQP